MLVNVTPVMTSNTTPAPYVVSSSDYNSTTQYIWNAFNNDGNTGSNFWHSTTGQGHWVKIDFGSVIKINAFSIMSYPLITSAPKSFILYGSNDNITYEKIIEFNNEILWSAYEVRLFKLLSSVLFRYYRINFFADNGYNAIVLSELKFWQDDGAIEYVTNRKASRLTSLPMNSTSNLSQRQNDEREALLGMANDEVNYGTLWIINNKGQAEIPKARLANLDLLFNGLANTQNVTYSLVDSYKKYKKLIIIGGVSNGTQLLSTLEIPTSMIITSLLSQFSLSGYASTGLSYFLQFKISSETSFIIDQPIYCNGWSGASISKIYGVK